MSDFKSRLITEQDELIVKTKKLGDFLTSLSSDNVTEIDPNQKMLLEIQLKAMETYSQCLLARLRLL